MFNQLFQEPSTDTNRQWYPTPETCDDPSKLNRLEKRIYDEITKLREEEKLDPTADDQQRKEFLANFKWENSFLDERERQQIENLQVKYNNVFAWHRLDIGINTDFKIKLTPKHDEPVYAQSLPTPTNLKDDLLDELALMQEYGIITTLAYNKIFLTHNCPAQSQWETPHRRGPAQNQPPFETRLQPTKPSGHNHRRYRPA